MFIGDYWVSEAEVIIKDINNENVEQLPEDDDAAGDSSFKTKSKRKSKSKSRPTRSLRGSLIPAVKSERDPVMTKLSSIIEPMKDAFFVARLHPKEYADYCASMRESNKLTDVAEKETERLKMMNDAGISEGGKSSSSSGKGKGVGDDQAGTEAAPSDGPKDGPAQSSSDAAASSQTSTTVEIKVENQNQMNVEVDPRGQKGAANGEVNAESKEADSKIEIPIEPLPSEPAGEETMDCDTKDDEQDAPPLTPSTGSRISRRVKGRGVKNEAPSSSGPAANALEETEGSDVSSEAAADKVAGSGTVSPVGLVDSESKAADDEVQAQPASDGKAATALVGKESEMSTVKIESDLLDVKEEASSSGAASDSVGVKQDPDSASSSSSVSKPPPFAIPGTAKVEIIKGVFLTDDTEDVDDTLESEHFDTRQSFLNLCQGNHYQFDQLRRAKHTSMMVLYHMHNPDAPKFVSNCNVCHRDILVGHKYRCEPCEQDYCPACYGVHGARVHVHPLRAMAVTAVLAPPTLTDEQRRQRQQAIDLHLTLLVHASSCVLGSDCKSRHCQKMKVRKKFRNPNLPCLPHCLRASLPPSPTPLAREVINTKTPHCIINFSLHQEILSHSKTCTVTTKRGCPICKRIQNLINMHSRSCRNDKCIVPNCKELKDHFK